MTYTANVVRGIIQQVNPQNSISAEYIEGHNRYQKCILDGRYRSRTTYITRLINKFALNARCLINDCTQLHYVISTYKSAHLNDFLFKVEAK